MDSSNDNNLTNPIDKIQSMLKLKISEKLQIKINVLYNKILSNEKITFEDIRQAYVPETLKKISESSWACPTLNCAEMLFNLFDTHAFTCDKTTPNEVDALEKIKLAIGETLATASRTNCEEKFLTYPSNVLGIGIATENVNLVAESFIEGTDYYGSTKQFVLGKSPYKFTDVAIALRKVSIAYETINSHILQIVNFNACQDKTLKEIEENFCIGSANILNLTYHASPNNFGRPDGPVMELLNSMSGVISNAISNTNNK